MERHYGDFEVFPKEIKFLIFRRLDSASLGRLLQLNKTYLNLVDELGIWKHLCISQWSLSPERGKQLTPDLSNKINWKREYRVLEEYSKRVYNNEVIIRAADSGLAKQIDNEPNTLHYHAFTDANMDAKAVSAQGKYKLYPLPHVNFSVAYYEVYIENFGPDEPIVGIGLALDKYLQAMPGWGKDSYGLHSDDGCFFNQRPFGIQFCEPWHKSDTFGLGINYATKELFVTKNGVLLGTLTSRVRNLLHLYPTVGIKRFDNKCRVNFGQQPFEFDVVQYLHELEKDDRFKSKWPFKLYSEIIEEFETQLLDTEDQEEVEQEFVGAMNYYEKVEVMTEEPKENVADEEEQQSERILEWLFGKLEILESENSLRDVEANRPEMRQMLTTLATNLDFPVDPNQPLTQMLDVLKDRVFVLLSSNYIDTLMRARDRRKAEHKANPDAKKHLTFTELDRIYRENAVLLLVDREFPDNHPIIRCIIRVFMSQMPLPPVVTEQDRVNACLVLAYRLFCSDQLKKAEKDIDKRRKLYQEQHKGKASFTEIYGPTSFIAAENKNEKLQDGLVNSTDDETSSNITYNDTDKILAQRYAAAMLFGPSLADDSLAMDHLPNIVMMLWWYLAVELPYDPNTSLDNFREQCFEYFTQELDELETADNWESILRGTYGTLCDNKEDQVIRVIVSAWDSVLKALQRQDKDPVEVIKRHLIGVIAEMSPEKAAEMVRTSRAHRAKTLQALRGNNQTNKPANHIENNNNKKVDKKKVNKKKVKSKTKEASSSQQNIALVAAVAVTVGLVAAGAFFLFQKKWRK